MHTGAGWQSEAAVDVILVVMPNAFYPCSDVCMAVLVQIQKTADSLKRTTAQLEQQNKALSGDLEQQRKNLSQQLFSAQQEADKVATSDPLCLPCLL